MATTVPCSYSAEGVHQDAFRICKSYINSLQICPTVSMPQSRRMAVVNETALCLAAVWKDDPSPSLLANYTSTALPAIEANSSCHYPTFEPILKAACDFDFQRLNLTCSRNNESVTTLTAPYLQDWLHCQNQAVIQYWRCTNQKSFNDTASCVTENAVKSDWLWQISTYQGARSCRKALYWLLSQAGSIIFSLFYAIVSVLSAPILKRKWEEYKARRQARKGLKKGIVSEESHGAVTFSTHGIQPAGSNPYYGQFNSGEKDHNLMAVTSSYSFGQSTFTPPKPSHWDLEDVFVLKANKLIASLGGDLLAIFLTVLVLQQTGQSAFASEKTTLWNMFLLYAVRPRVAPFTGALGLMKGWSQEGLADLFADFLLSCVAGICVGIHFVIYYWVPPKNPLAPAAQLKLLAIGALLAGGPTLLSLMITLLGFGPSTSDNAADAANRVVSGPPSAFDVIWSLIKLGVRLICIALFIAALPFIAILEIVTMLQIAIRGRDRKKNEHGKRWKSRFEEPLRTNSPRAIYIYSSLVVLSWMVNAGNWIFFSVYLNLEGDVYCPSSSLYVTLIWIFIPAAVKIPVTLLGLYIGD